MSDKGRKVLNIILALLVSMSAWVFVVYNYDPMTRERYMEIPVTYTGLDNLANRGYAVAETAQERVDVVLEQKRIDTGSISIDDISVTADVSGLASGENTVVLRAQGPEGTQVSDISLKTVTIDIESSDSKDMDISIEYPDTAEADAEPIVEGMSESVATVVATEDRLANVDKVVAIVDPADLTEKLRPLTVELAALDRSGNKVHNVVVYPESVSFKVAAGYTKEVQLDVPVVDDSNDQYERSFTAPKTIVIKGSKKLIGDIDSIKSDEIYISQFYEDAEMPLTFDLPEGIYLANGYEDLVLKVTVKEKEVKDKNEDEKEDDGE